MKRFIHQFSPGLEGSVFKNPHLLAILAIGALLVFLYRSWPWINWEPVDNITLPWLVNLAYFEFHYRAIGILFLAPIFYAAVFFRWRGTLFAWLLSLLGVLPTVIEMWGNHPEYLVINLGFLLLPFLAVSLVTLELQWHARERKMSADREEERQKYVAKVLEAQENERKRISQELHDDTIQTLLLILSHAEALTSDDSFDPAEVKKNGTRIRDITVSAVENLRRISIDLRPGILDNLGLIPALRWLVNRMNSESAIDCRILINGPERKLSPQVESNIFRIVQEALNNIRRHSKASNAIVALEFTDNCLKISIQDDGQGFLAPREVGLFANKGRLGLIGIQQRISSLNGTLQIHSGPGEGTMLRFEVNC